MKRLVTTFMAWLLIIALSACATKSTATQNNLTSDPVGVSNTATETTIEPTPEAGTESTLTLASGVRETHESTDDYTWEESQAITITLEGSTATTSGTGVSVDGSLVTITEAGTYSLNGTLDDGQIIVNTNDKDTVKIVLNGAEITSTTSAPLYIKNAEKIVVILAEGKENTLMDGYSYVDEDTDENDPNAALFSNADLTIYGSGTLNVDGNYGDGITSKDGLIIAGGNITVNAVDDGIRGKDYIWIKDGELRISATGDGLKADNDEDTTQGYVIIQSGSLEVTSGGDAITAQTDVVIDGGTFMLASGGGSGVWLDGESSAKGIKGLAGVIINSGTFTINAADDAIHSNGDITVNGGSLQLASGDDGIHADTSLTINGGEVTVNESYEGIESAVITINDGNILIISSDDGINVASGVDGSGFGMNPGGFGAGNMPPAGQPGIAPGGQPGGNPFDGPMQDVFDVSGDYYLYVYGGTIYVDANGDGVDVNGSIEMNAGLMIVNGPTENMNSALDYMGSFTISGGTLAAAGSAGMAQAPGEDSSQNSVLINLDSSQPAGSPIHIQDAAGKNLVTFTPTKTYQSFVFSSGNLKTGSEYTIFSGGSSSGETVHGLVTSGNYDPGTEVTSFTLASALTSLGRTAGMNGGRRK